jgi:exopolysaccharide production protein ExoZ
MIAKAPGEVRSIQYLRGLAALGVLVFHAADRAGWAFGTGAAGVDVFFVISGFIMWVVTCSRDGDPRGFMVRRLQRIVPLYWAVTLITAAIAVFVPGAFPAMQVTAGAVAKSLFFIPYRDPQGLIAPLIVPGWTLNFEMFFYLLFAAGLLAPARIRALLVSAALVGLVALRPFVGGGPVAQTYTDPILLEFAAGVWLGWLWSHDRLPGPRTGWALVALGLAGFTAVGLSGVDITSARPLWWGLPAFALVVGAVSIERHGRVPNLAPLRALGDASYSVYLIHGLAISATLRALALVGVTAPALVFAAAIVVGVTAGLLAYRLIEKPAMRLFHTGLGAHRPRRAAVAS